MESSTFFEEAFAVKVIEGLKDATTKVSVMSLHIKSPVIQKYWNSCCLGTESLNLFSLFLDSI